MSEASLREEICAFGKSLFDRGLTFGSAGNISARVSDGWLMTPTNSSLGRLDPAALSKVDERGQLISGDKPSKEYFLHLSMYAERPNAGAIVHLHSTHSVAVSVLADLDRKIPSRRSRHTMSCASDGSRWCLIMHPATLHWQMRYAT